MKGLGSPILRFSTERVQMPPAGKCAAVRGEAAVTLWRLTRGQNRSPVEGKPVPSRSLGLMYSRG